MCDEAVYQEKIGQLEDYLEFVNTDIDRLMRFEVELYAAYATLNDLTIERVKEWYQDAESKLVSANDPWLYLSHKYDVWNDDDIEYYYDIELGEGIIHSCGGYWFSVE